MEEAMVQSSYYPSPGRTKEILASLKQNKQVSTEAKIQTFEEGLQLGWNWCLGESWSCKHWENLNMHSAATVKKLPLGGSDRNRKWNKANRK